MVEQDIEFITFDGQSILKSDYRNEIIDEFIQSTYDGLTQITDFSVGSEAYHLADLMANLMLEHREGIDDNYRMGLIHYAEGEFLDNMGDRAGVHRIQASPSTGEVTFTLDSEREDTVEIPADTVVATDDAISFILTDDAVIYPGETTATVEALCELEGEYTNVLPGTVNIIITELGITGLTVTNEDYFTDGADVEEDDDYRARILQAPGEAPTGSLQWFENVCLSDTNVASKVHDVLVRKNVTGYTEDIVIYYHAYDLTDTTTYNDEIVTMAYMYLVELFNQPVYNMVGVELAFEPGAPVTVLPDDDEDYTYYFAVVLDDDILLENIIEDIEACIIEYNSNTTLADSFSPDTLSMEIEDSVDGVFRCRILQYDENSDSYTMITDNNYSISCEDNEYIEIDTDNLSDRITEASFTIDVTPV